MKTIYTKIGDLDLSSMEKFKNWKLCYIDAIPETYSDYDEASAELVKTDAYKEFTKKVSKWLKENCYNTKGFANMGDIQKAHAVIDPINQFKTSYKEYDTPEYVEGYTHYLYFTSDFENQWGDDWDDAPYEYNAEEPYDHKTDVLKIACKLPDNAYLPRDRFHSSPYSVEDINSGAIPWIWDCIKKTYLMGGFTLEQSLPLLYEYYKNLSDF